MDGTAAYTPMQTPFLNNYSGLSNEQLMNQVSLQENYHPQAPNENQVEALKLVGMARDAALGEKVDPALIQQLLQRALNEITPQGQGSQPSFPASAPASYPSSYPVQGNSAQGDGDADDAVSASSQSGAPSLTSDPASNSIDTGRYLITGSGKDDGSLTIHDKQTGKDVEIWGDPHVKVNGQNVADFQKNGLSIQLDDGTTVHIKPTDLQNGVSHIGQVAVTKGNDAVTMSGFQSGPMHTSDDMQGQASNVSGMYDDPANTNLTEGDDDNLYYNNANGSMGGMVKANDGGGETNLDGKGGGMIGHPGAGGAGGGSGSNYANIMNQLIQSASSNMSEYMQSALSSMLADIMSHSGYEKNA